MIICQTIPKRKKLKPDAKARMLKASWEEILRKYNVKSEVRNPAKLFTNNSRTVLLSPSRSTNNFPSMDTGIGIAAKKESPKYTGNAMLGISVLHKSNAIPVFRAEDIKDISKMRR